MTAKSVKRSEKRAPATAADLALLERLIAAGMLVTRPPNASGKPRRVMAAALAPDRRSIVLWLSNKTTEIGRRA